MCSAAVLSVSARAVRLADVACSGTRTPEARSRSRRAYQRPVLPGEGSADAAHVLIEEIFRMARSRVDQRAGDPADGVVPPVDELVAPTPGACLDDAQLGVFCPARRLLIHRACLADPVQILLECLGHAFPGGQPVPEPLKLLDEFLRRQAAVGEHNRVPQKAPLPGRELLDPLLPGFHLIPPGRGEDGRPQLGADRRQPGLFQLRQLAGSSLDRLDQGGKTVRAEALQRETILHHALGSGKTVTYVAQLGGGRGQFRWRGELFRRRAGTGAPERSRRGRAPWPAGTGPRSRPRTAGR